MLPFIVHLISQSVNHTIYLTKKKGYPNQTQLHYSCLLLTVQLKLRRPAQNENIQSALQLRVIPHCIFLYIINLWRTEPNPICN
jgi:hypothetical protein